MISILGSEFFSYELAKLMTEIRDTYHTDPLENLLDSGVVVSPLDPKTLVHRVYT